MNFLSPYRQAVNSDILIGVFSGCKYSATHPPRALDTHFSEMEFAMSRLRPLSILALLVIAATLVHAQTFHAFLWSAPNGMKDLGTLGGNSYAHSINNVGHVVGDYCNGLGNFRAFLWTPKTGMQDLGTLAGPSSIPTSINSKAQLASRQH